MILLLVGLIAPFQAQAGAAGDAPAGKHAVPIHQPQNWITSDDTRLASMQSAYGGVVEFTLDIDIQGKPTNCTVTKSNVAKALGTFTCKLMMQRAYFEPATDGAGAPVAGTYSSRARWTF